MVDIPPPESYQSHVLHHVFDGWSGRKIQELPIAYFFDRWRLPRNENFARNHSHLKYLSFTIRMPSASGIGAYSTILLRVVFFLPSKSNFGFMEQ